LKTTRFFSDCEIEKKRVKTNGGVKKPKFEILANYFRGSFKSLLVQSEATVSQLLLGQRAESTIDLE
jgi:hypothetical protein